MQVTELQQPSDSRAGQKPIVAIAGGTGLVGSRLVQHLQSRFRLRILTRSESRVQEPRDDLDCEWVRCDLFSLPQVESAMQSVDILHVLNAFTIVLEEPGAFEGVFDLASHPPMTYGQMITETAALLGRKPPTFRTP